MKRNFIIAFLLLLLVPILTSAKVNTLKLTEDNMKIVYEESLYDKEMFMNHTDMIPSNTYIDTLVIDNETDSKFDLYMQIPFKTTSGRQDLLDYLTFKIYIDGDLLYEGSLPEDDYMIYLGDFSSFKKATLRVETTLDSSFSDLEEKENLYFDVKFSANKEIIVPNTSINDNKLYLAVAGVIGIGIVISFLFIMRGGKSNV